MSEALSQAAHRMALWRANPVQFVRDNFDVEPDEWQKKALMAWGDQNKPKLRIALQAFGGPGKSAFLAWVGLNGISCYASEEGHPKGACLSISRDNLRDNLWAEISKWRERSKFLSQAFTQTSERLFANDYQKTWFLAARAFSVRSNADEQGRALSGLRAPFVFLLLDETGDMPVPVLKAGEQAFSDTWCKFARIAIAGNPTSHTGVLYHAATRPHRWFLIAITGDPDDPMCSPRVDKEWAREQIEEFGRDDPWVQALILGRFPPTAINQLLGPDDVQDAIKRRFTESDIVHYQKRLGIDVARFGDDRTCIIARQGLVAFQPEILRKQDTHKIAGRVMVTKTRWGSEQEFVDDTGGWGAGVIDNLTHAGYPPVPVNSSESADDPRFFNKRSEMWWRMCQWVKKTGCIPKHTGLQRELVVPTYTMFKGKIRVEEKESIKRRLKQSPDVADALALTFAQVELPAANVPGAGTVPGMPAHYGARRGAKMESDWDPLSEEHM